MRGKKNQSVTCVALPQMIQEMLQVSLLIHIVISKLWILFTDNFDTGSRKIRETPSPVQEEKVL